MRVAAEFEEVPTIRRWELSDLDEWMLERLKSQWPDNAPETWAGRLLSFSRSNDYLFVVNERCMLLATMGMRHAMTGKPVVLEILGWSRDARKDVSGRTNNWVIPSESQRQMLDLYRYELEWAKSMRSARIIVGCCSDLSPSMLKLHTRGDYLVDVLL